MFLSAEPEQSCAPTFQVTGGIAVVLNDAPHQLLGHFCRVAVTGMHFRIVQVDEMLQRFGQFEQRFFSLFFLHIDTYSSGLRWRLDN